MGINVNDGLKPFSFSCAFFFLDFFSMMRNVRVYNICAGKMSYG